MSIFKKVTLKLWNLNLRNHSTLWVVGLPALALGLVVGSAFAVKRPWAQAGEGKFADRLDALGDRIETALHLDRVKLNLKLLEEESTRGNLEKLRFHVNQALVIQYDTGEREVSHEAGSDGIEEVSTIDIHRLRISPKVKGKIVAQSADLKEIHITFDRYCTQADCALKFVAQQGTYILASIPPKVSYENATAYATVLGLRYKGGKLDEDRLGALHNGARGILAEQIQLTVRKDTLTEVNLTKEHAEGVE
jgi:hypothetical protein